MVQFGTVKANALPFADMVRAHTQGFGISFVLHLLPYSPPKFRLPGADLRWKNALTNQISG
jgi:hypothetical protein